MDHVLFFCGGAGSLVHDKCQDLVKTCNLQPTPMLSIADLTQFTFKDISKSSHKDVSKVAESDHNLSLEKCGHRFPSDEYCSFCIQNRDKMEERTRKLFETYGGSASTLVTADLCSSSSMWTYDQVMEILTDMLPRATHGTMFLLPCQPLHGWDAYLATYCYSLSLQLSGYTILRNLAEPFYAETVGEATTPSSQSLNMGLSDCAERIAADILPNYLFQEKHGSICTRGLSWPYSVCSYGERVIDVRSSLLYKLHMMRRKKPSRDHLHPLKVVTSSLHRLGAFYQEICASNSAMELFNQQETYLIDYRDLVWDRKYGAFNIDSLKGLRKYSSNDMAKLFRHSTPGISWTTLEDFVPATSSTDDDTTSMASTTRHRSTPGSISSGTISSTRKSLSGIAYSHSNDTDEAAEHLDGLGSLTFQSPFGEMELLRTSHYSQQMLTRGGYRHLFHGGFDADTVLDCIATIDMYLNR